MPEVYKSWEFVKKLGSGSYGIVCEYANPEERIAIKFAKVPKDGSKRLEFILANEVIIMQQLHSPFTATLKFCDTIMIHTSLYQLLGLDFVPGISLSTIIKNAHAIQCDSALRWSEVRAVFAQLVFALHYLHSIHCIHCDVCPNNIMVDMAHNHKLTLIDFGCALMENQVGPATTTQIGTPSYMCPEIVRCENITHKSDVWSAGVVLYEMCAGRLPFTMRVIHRKGHPSVVDMPSDGFYFDPNTLSPEKMVFAPILSAMLQPIVVLRISADTLIDSEPVREYFEIIESPK